MPTEVEEVQERPIKYRRYKYLFLIVCEDEKTEPEYFGRFQAQFPDETLYLKPVGAGCDAKGVAERAIVERDALAATSKKEVDETWIVFDKDDLDLKPSTAGRFNEAFTIAQTENFSVAYSNESFELWLLLHVRNISGNQPIGRREVEQMMVAEIQLHQQYAQFEYKHGDAEILDVIAVIGSETNATQRADALIAHHTGSPRIEANPSTSVHLLVNKLREWIAYFCYEP